MTSTTSDSVYREVTPDEAVTSVVGYLKRSWEQLAADHVNGKITPATLSAFAEGLGIMVRRLTTAADVLGSGDPDARMLVTDQPYGLVRCLTCGEIIPTSQATEHAGTHLWDDGSPMPVLFREPDRF